MTKTVRIEINFQVAVDFPPGFEQALDGLIGMVCDKYEAENQGRVMWPAGAGSKILWREPEEPGFDDSVYAIDVAEREMSEKELERQKRQQAKA